MITLEYLRSFKVEGYAIFDIVVSFVWVYLLSGLLSKLFLKIGIFIPKRNWLYLTLPIGVIAHLIVGRMTPMTKDVLNPHGGYIIKAILLVLIVLGLLGIKFVGRG